MSQVRSFMTRFLLSVLLIICTMLISSSVTYAETLKLNLKELGADDANVELKTVKTFRDFYFTKPEYWKAQSSSKMVLSFQHSSQLLPERSSLNILINDQSIQTIELNKGNSEKTTVTFNIPPDVLKDYNKLTFDVDQHYTYKCEDPFDPALWTTVLKQSTLYIDYKKVTPEIDFALFPYPFFDVLGYGNTKLNFVALDQEEASDKTLRAMAMIDASIAQKVSWKDLIINLVEPNKATSGNMIVIGTPAENKMVRSLQGKLPYKISDGLIVDANGNDLEENDGLLVLASNPSDKTSVILVVTGNSPAGVLKAASVLTQKPTKEILKGQIIQVREALPNQLSSFRDWPEFLRKKTSRFIDVGLQSITTRGVTSVPIKYYLKIMPDMSMPPKTHAKLKVVMSYSAHLDPEQSKLEVILNNKSSEDTNISYQSILLNNTDGENLREFTVKIPTEELRTYNILKFKFHMFPIKYDICRFTTDQHIWGTIHNVTSVELPADIKAVIPDLGLLNDGGYPFTAYQDLQDTVFVLAEDYTNTDLYGMLTTIARLAKMTSPTNAQNIGVVKTNNFSGDLKSTKNIITIGISKRNSLIKDIEAELHMLYDDNSFKLFKKEKDSLAELKDVPNQGIVEQMLSPWNNKRVVMVLYGKDDSGLKNAISLFADTSKFNAIDRSNIVAVVGNTVQSVISLTQSQARQLSGEQAKQTQTNKEFWWNLLKIFVMVIGIIAIVRFILGFFFRG